MSKYRTLLNILDQLRGEAPPEHKRYHPSEADLEALNQARARAFIHLYLKVKFGLVEFKDRERLVTDGPNDGGIDAYYIDEDSKKVYFLQAKFRTTEDNFQEKEIELNELLSMDVDRVTNGEEADEFGNPYNGKIKQLIREITDISDMGRYKYEVVLLANLKNIRATRLRKLTGGFDTVVFNHERTYRELVFPVIKGTYYYAKELKIYINLTNKSSASAKITYEVRTSYKNCDITVLFVPTIEIARTLYKYRNSILKFNPRSYLELENNTVNREIADTIENLNTNEFALYNNGITILSYGTDFNERIGQKDKAQLILTQPQIINGGQTAYTLSRLYEEHVANPDLDKLFADKEVLVKVITFAQDNDDENPNQLKLIEAVSKATNQQTTVHEADRRSNDKIQIEMQNAIYHTYGYFYERKRGEYADGIRAGYIDRTQIINRELFLRLCKCCDFSPAAARSSVKQLFKPDNFSKTLNDLRRYKEYFFAFRCHEALVDIERGLSAEGRSKFGAADYGFALRYGKFAVVTACMMKYNRDQSEQEAERVVQRVLKRWQGFESYVAKVSRNSNYFWTYADDTGTQREVSDYDGYYKGRTLSDDLSKYFPKSR